MCSKLTDKEIDGFRKILFSLDENGDASFNVRNLELALNSIQLTIADNELKKITSEVEKESDDESMLKKVLEYVEERRNRGNSKQIKKNVIGCLRSLIELLGHVLTTEEVEEIIVEGENGNIKLDKILSILETIKTNNNNAATGEWNDLSKINLQNLRRRLYCLGIISKALSKGMTEEDLVDLLSNEEDRQDQMDSINYSKLLKIMEHKMKELCQLEDPHHHEHLYKFEEGYRMSLDEVRSVMSTLGSVLINMGEKFTDTDFKQIIEKEWTINDSVFPKMVLKLMEEQLSCGEDDNDVIKEFRALDQQGTGFVTVEDFRIVLSKSPDPFTDAEIDEFLKEAEINERGEFNYHDYIARMAQNKK